MRAAIISGLSAAGFALGSWAVPVIFPEVDPVYAEAALWVAGGCLVLALVLWLIGSLKNSEADKGSGINQLPTASGSHSPAIAVMGDYHNHPSPMVAPTPAPKPYLTGDGPPPQARPAPDIPVRALYSRVYKKLGGAPIEQSKKAEFYKLVNREIADAVVLNQLSTWGYYMDTPIRPIAHDYWQNGVFNHLNKTLSIQGDSVRPMIFSDLKFNKGETDAIWPG